MADKNTKPIKPTPAKPQPVKPTTTKPQTVKPIKAEGSGGNCIRCNSNPAASRAVCATCDYNLQQMHFALEYFFDGKVRYMPEDGEAKWFTAEYGSRISKPYPPKFKGPRRNVNSAEGPALSG